MIRRFTKSRPALIVTFVLLWTFHFSFGIFQHYHPDYVHAHDSASGPHSHGGHFHSLELERLASFIAPGEHPPRPGETHHHSESLPGGDSETVQYDFNSSGITKVKVAVDSILDAAPVPFDCEKFDLSQSPIIASGTHRILLYPQSHSERSPPLRI